MLEGARITDLREKNLLRIHSEMDRTHLERVDRCQIIFVRHSESHRINLIESLKMINYFVTILSKRDDDLRDQMLVAWICEPDGGKK